MVQRLRAGDDHPLMMTVPEAEYLKGCLAAPGPVVALIAGPRGSAGRRFL